jgi:hypothetical protein
LQMALPCHLIAQKCHSSKLLQAKPLKGLGRRIPNSADASHPERAASFLPVIKCST